MHLVIPQNLEGRILISSVNEEKVEMRSISKRVGTICLAVGFALVARGLEARQTEDQSVQPKQQMEYAIAIHGGAGSNPKRFSDEANRQRRRSLEKALRIGTDILKSGGSSLEAVEKVVLFLEDDPQFNAGKGAVFNAAGGHELDASIMDGSGLQAGAIGGVTTVKNPIRAARAVMENSKHVFFTNEGAEKFAADNGLELVKPDYFRTDRRWKQFLNWRKQEEARAHPP